MLTRHFPALALAPGARIFVPLCGKTLDIDWLLAQGHRVAGAELSELAVAQLFERLAHRPQLRRVGPLQCWSAPGLDIFTGDIMTLQAAQLGETAAVYDRAALIALPPAMRRDYSAHLTRLTGGAPQLLVTLEYDQRCIDGPPFSVPAAQIRELHADRVRTLLATHEVEGGIKGRCEGTENVWLLGGTDAAA